MTHLSKSDCITAFYQKITLLSIYNAIGTYKESCPCAANPTQGPVLFIAPGPELALDGPAFPLFFVMMHYHTINKLNSLFNSLAKLHQQVHS